MNHFRRMLFFCILATLLSGLVSCAPGKLLKTQNAAPAEIRGNYTVFLIGGQYLEDLRTVAILQKEGTPYTFEIYAPEFNYSVKKGIRSDEALKEAELFVSTHPLFRNSLLSKVFDPAGNVIAFEVLPTYDSAVFRDPVVLDVDYRLKDGSVIVYVNLRSLHKPFPLEEERERPFFRR